MSLVTLTQVISLNREGEGIEAVNPLEQPVAEASDGPPIDRFSRRHDRPARCRSDLGRARPELALNDAVLSAAVTSRPRRRGRVRPSADRRPSVSSRAEAAAVVDRDETETVAGNWVTRLVITGAIVAAAFRGATSHSGPKVEEEGACGTAAIGRPDRPPHVRTAARPSPGRRAWIRPCPAPRTRAVRAARRIVPLSRREVEAWVPDSTTRAEIRSIRPWHSRRDFSMLRARKRELLDEQRSCWAEGRPLEPEELLGRWPTNPDSDPDAASLLLEDYLQRRRRGEETSLVGIRAALSRAEASARRAAGAGNRLPLDGRRERRPGFSLRLPDVGDEVFGFRLCQPLGQGAFGRVFLAEQADLAGRPVVLKVTAIEGDEPQTLAQLLHTNIVPIYSLHEDQRAGLRAVCMPYLGGASLSAVLAKLWTDSPRPVSGKQLVLALEAVEAPKPATFQSKDERTSPNGDSARARHHPANPLGKKT